ncbi:XRE family transcriptional regulator [Pseudoalteromonas sp. JC28]|uniref:helix-turn-helix domain-containing protein n=1 Tax=Pseudoalteromonas sp. JC28 TaxID=2267617 RepID=UPI0015716024|nr:helix-turn-helix transcriptional regulator [Pseudoalteromonas sp. JC28]NSY36599.1 XRE family transcriptional regulator [Pseudoalteromonas sp. JC28]
MSLKSTETDINVCSLFQAERKRLNLSQKDVADFLGMSSKQISRWESSIAIPSDKLVQLASMGFDAAFVVTGNRAGVSLIDQKSLDMESAVDAACYAAREALLTVYQAKRLKNELGENGEFDAIKSLSLIEKATRILMKAELTGNMSNDSIRDVLNAVSTD